MRKAILALILLLVLGGGGAGAYFYFSQSAEAAATDELEDNHDAHKKEAKKDDGHGDDGHGGASYHFVELDPLILPIVDEDGVSQVVNLVVVLEVVSLNAVDETKALSPRLKDAFIQDLYGVLNQHAALRGGVVQVSMLKKRLSKISKKVLGDDQVNGVLLQVVQQRPI